MPSKLLRAGLVTAALTALPTLAHTQAAPAMPAAPAAPAAAPAPAAPAAPVEAAPMTEAQQLQAQITAVQTRAAQDAAVLAANAAILTAMEAADPEFKSLSERGRTIRVDIAAAQAAADNATLRTLAAEAQTLNASIATARARVATNPDVVAKTAAYRTALFQKMVELEPTVQAAITRLAELRR